MANKKRKSVSRKWEGVFAQLEVARGNAESGDRKAAAAVCEIAVGLAHKYVNREGVREETNMGLTIGHLIENELLKPLADGNKAPFDGVVRTLKGIIRREAALSVVRSVQREHKPSTARKGMISQAMTALMRGLKV